MRTVNSFASIFRPVSFLIATHSCQWVFFEPLRRLLGSSWSTYGSDGVSSASGAGFSCYRPLLPSVSKTVSSLDAL